MECNFARTAIKELLQEHNTNGKKLDVHKINEEYNKLFKSYPGMHISAIAASKIFLSVSKNFNKRWHPQTRRDQYIQAFCRENWQSLSEGEKAEHVLKKCKCCEEKYRELTKSFPATPICNKSAHKQSKTPPTCTPTTSTAKPGVAVTPSSTLVTPSSSLVTPSSSLVTPSSSLVPPSSSLVTPSSSLVTPSSSLVTPSSSLVTPSSSLVTPSSSLVPPSSSLVTPSSSLVTPSSSLVPPSSSLVPPSSSLVTPSLTTTNLCEERFVKEITKLLNCSCQQMFGKSFENLVITNTTKEKVLPNHSEHYVVKKTKDEIQKEMNRHAYDMVMATRTSWNAYNTMRLTLGLEKRDAAPCGSKGREQKTHGYSQQHIESVINKQSILEEARAWEPEQKINWSNLASQHGLTTENRGQIIKEYLALNNIPAAIQMTKRQGRRAKRKLSEYGISVPMFKPVKVQKKCLDEKIERDEIQLGIPVAGTELTSYTICQETKEVIEVKTDVQGKLIPIDDIRKQLLKKHEALGIIRAYTNDEVEGMNTTDLINIAKQMRIPYTNDEQEMRSSVIQKTRTRFFKTWHDHAEIAGHSHFLCTISSIYDPAFYYTTEEMMAKGKKIDVEYVVEQPEVYILARSKSSLQDQAAFNKSRSDDLTTLSTPISTAHGVPIIDTLRIFHGDGPARQFEAGNNVGGYYPCTGCGVLSTLFDDIVHSYRCKTITIAERQEFILAGNAWKMGTALNKLTAKQLHTEMTKHGLKADGRKTDMIKDFREKRMGINSLPALMQSNPEQPIDDGQLRQYEICSTEPLHDIRNHIANLIDAVLPMLSGKGKLEDDVKQIIASVLGKETKRCSDYRKASLLILKAMQSGRESEDITLLFTTACEIQEILYAKESNRNETSILRLHNIAFMHGMLCNKVLPKLHSQKHIYGNYFHSIICHAPQWYRLISLRSINTEHQERLFKQANGITARTSNMHPDHMINNILVRMQEEKRVKGESDPLLPDESVIGKLATVLQKPPRSYFSNEWIKCHQQQFQSHLERISDYLLDGPGKWWILKEDGIEFNDLGSQSTMCTDHFRHTNMAAIVLKLHNCWEQCLVERVKLPMPSEYIKTYNGMGLPIMQPSHQTSSTFPSTSIPTPASPSHLNSASTSIPTPASPSHLNSASTSIPTPASPSHPNSASTSIPTPASPSHPNSATTFIPKPASQSHPASATLPSTCTLILTPSTSTTDSQQHRLFTNLGRNLQKILPDQQELINEIDSLRHEIKTSSHVSHQTIRKNREKCKQIKTKVLEILDTIDTHKHYMIAKSILSEFHNL